MDWFRVQLPTGLARTTVLSFPGPLCSFELSESFSLSSPTGTLPQKARRLQKYRTNWHWVRLRAWRWVTLNEKTPLSLTHLKSYPGKGTIQRTWIGSWDTESVCLCLSMKVTCLSPQLPFWLSRQCLPPLPWGVLFPMTLFLVATMVGRALLSFAK